MKKLVLCAIIVLVLLITSPGLSAASPPKIVITEIMQNPAAVSDTNGEWFELYNPTTEAVNLKDWVIKDDGSNSQTISSDLWISPGEYKVLCRNIVSASNGGVTCDYKYTGLLSNSADEIILMDGAIEIDAVRYDDGAAFPDPTGASMALKSPVLDNAIGLNWCTSKTPFGTGDLGTPGRANDCTQSEEIPEFPSTALPVFVAGTGYLFIRRRRSGGSS
ncbi:MAG TPA: lamin tail domain-containing protein [Euryarchaeota archaeon]|nr:hypothetical protein BMS3Abin16_00253 [archaeon BMS3Abin16]HDH28868.1 lamin tail domain-containing protein [Euryarchaeota archaeon]HDY74200.1 lamin tail domain-containing protein [Euryarchaeota archaeon]